MLSIFSSKEQRRSIARAIEDYIKDYYEIVKNKLPEEQQFVYLGFAWALFLKRHHKKEYQDKDFANLVMATTSGSLLFSFLDYPDSVKALSYFVIYKEKLGIEKEYESEYNKIMSKISVNDNQIKKLSEYAVGYLVDKFENLGEINEKYFE